MRRLPSATELGLNLAPMVDVMMCLLIFFMLATKMVEQENSRIDLPAARAAKEADKQALGSRFVVNIRADGEGGAPAYIVREQAMPFGEVMERLAGARQLDPEVNCVIRADRNVAYRHVEVVLLACANAGIHKITFGAVREEGGTDR